MAARQNWLPGQRAIKVLVLEALQKHGRVPLPSEEIRNLVARKRTGVRVGTVNHALQALCRKGFVKRIQLSANRVAWQAAEHAWPERDTEAA